MSCDDLIFCKTMSYDILRFSHFAKQWVVMLWSFKKKKWYFYILQNNKLWHFDIFQQWYSNIFIFSKTGSSDTLIICKKMICDTLISLYVANEWIVIFWYFDTGKTCTNIIILIVEIAVWLWRLQSDFGDCSLILEIAVWL